MLRQSLRRLTIKAPFVQRTGLCHIRSIELLCRYSTTKAPALSDDRALEIMHKTQQLETTRLAPLNQTFLGPLERRGEDDDRLTSLPFVFCLGNHSSGKSTFINHVLGRPIQTTGVAPTDDGFTIIAPGDHDLDQDGPALVGDPDLGFAGLRGFGPSLIQRTALKVRSNVGINFMLVDSPGMIDSPTSHVMSKSQIKNATSVVGQSELSDRGYDFAKVTRWYAERADVILLFFDPDKPGTTGETLSILTSSLLGLDHKLHIVLNKVDQFSKIHDFARAYGSLCWNLSKVIPRKDLPRIYTMCIPASERGESESSSSSSMAGALAELDSTRDEVVHEVLRAPERRVDNVITRLYDSTRLLQMHTSILEAVRSRYRKELWNSRALTSAVALGGASVVTMAVSGGVPLEFAIASGLLSTIGTGAMHWHNSKGLAELEKSLMSDAGLNAYFKKTYSRSIAEGDEFILSLWKRVLPQLQLAITTLGISSLPKLKSADADSIKNLLTQEIPALRREAAPSDKSFAHQVASFFRSKK